jgi:ubiquitin-like modifier-activating enzyme ATG7
MTNEGVDGDIAATCERWIASGGASAWLVSEDGREAYALTEYEARTRAGAKPRLAFADACCAMTHPGWTLRNLAVLASARWGASALDVVCVRARKGRVAAEACVKFTMSFPKFDVETMKVVGWERNARGKMGPRTVDLGASMDPNQLASQAVDLNLKLMRWRLLPELDQEKLAATKCLLIGAGTLGCAVARTLMGWGVKHITFVDSGRVSYSNPVRQSLFEFEDCLDGGAPKAAAAAKKLTEIFPGMFAKGVLMSIPMPGHSVSEKLKASVFKDVDDIEALIDAHDVVYVLTDTRESRWLPTLICADKGKLCINTALGFNTYLVMRHGCGVDHASSSRLGCYFCNDVMAPANSTKDRTLDQQCTVTRPGLAPIASALAAELMVALLHAENGVTTSPPTREQDVSAEREADSSPLGVVPHQIRGSVAGFTQTLFDAPCFPRCTACSTAVVAKYRDDRDGFLTAVFDDPKTLEDATGLTDLLGAVDANDAEWLDDDSDDAFDV